MRPLYIQRYLLTGLLTFIPIWLTWAVFKFIFSLLSQVNLPLVAAVFSTLAEAFPETIGSLNQGWLVSILAFIVTVVALYVTGWAASHVFGRRLIAIFEGLIQRIPLAHTIYSGTKKLMGLLQKKPAGTQRVVLIDFPSPELKSDRFRDTRIQGRRGPRARRRVRADDAESDRRLSRDRADRAAGLDRLDGRSGDGFHSVRRRSGAGRIAIRDRAVDTESRAACRRVTRSRAIELPRQRARRFIIRSRSGGRSLL